MGATAKAVGSLVECLEHKAHNCFLLERCGERGDYVIRGGRLLSVLQKPNSMEVLSAIRGEPLIVGRVLERTRSKVREETGRLSPSQSVTAFRLSSMVIGRLSGNLVFLGFDQSNCSLNSFTTTASNPKES